MSIHIPVVEGLKEVVKKIGKGVGGPFCCKLVMAKFITDLVKGSTK